MNVRMAAPPWSLELQYAVQTKASHAICFKALTTRWIQSVRAEFTLDSEMSLEFARLDMSKPWQSRDCREKGIAQSRAARSRPAV